MTYKELLTAAMDVLALDPKFRFIGYNVKYGSKANGTLKNVCDDQLIETPVAENLVAGLAIGYALRGHPCLTWIERFDFMLNAADAIFNHADVLQDLSGGQFRGNVIFRTIVGNKRNPLFTGITHTQDYSEPFARIGKNIKVVRLTSPYGVVTGYSEALSNLSRHSTLIVEYRDLYDATL